MSDSLTEPAKLLLLAALLTNDKIISNNGKAFLKEMILRRDTRVAVLLKKFEVVSSGDSSFLESLHELIMSEEQNLYNELFFDTSLEVGKTLSKTERDDKNLSQEKSLIYGEVEFNSFYRVLRKINPAPGKVFYDLGSGTGKAVFAARFAYDFSKCIGIEILHGLHTQAEIVLDRYNHQFKSQLALGQSQHAMVYEGSFLDFDWSDGEVVFANSTCFDDALMLSLSHMAERLCPGAIVVTFTKGMTSPAFELLERKRYRMSWGPATVFIHRRRNLDGSSLGPSGLNILPSDDVTYDDDLHNKSVDSLDHAHTVHDYSSKNSSSSNNNSDDEGEDEDSDNNDADYDDDIDMYIKQGFDMDPDAEGEDVDSDGDDISGTEGNNDDEEEEEENEDSGDDRSGQSDDSEEQDGSDGNSSSSSDEEEEEDDNEESDSVDSDTPRGTHSRDVNLARPQTAPSSQQQQHDRSPTEDRLNTIMDKIADRRRVISELTGYSSSLSPDAKNRPNNTSSNSNHNGLSTTSSSASPNSHNNSSNSPSRILRTNTAATPPSTGGSKSGQFAHSTPTSSFTPPHSPLTAQQATPNANHSTPSKNGTHAGIAAQHITPNGSANKSTPDRHGGHTITIEAPLSASRGNLTMLNPHLMRSPARANTPLNLSTSSLNSNNSASGMQIDSPLDSALLNRKRASASNKRVPMSAHASPFREDF